MKMFLAAAAFLFSGTVVSGECVEVTPIMMPTFQVSADIVVTASLDGKRTAAVRIEVLTAFNEPRFSLVADERGVAQLPVLSPGSYHIVAITPPQPLGEVYLAEINFDVSQNLLNHPSFLNMDLVPANRFWPRDPPVEELWAPIGKPLAVGAVQRFRGSVIDPTGSAIAGATIRVFKQKSSAQVLITEIKADESGRFSARLGPGAYTASVKMRAFRIRMITFEIAPEADTKDVEISLDIGSC